MTSPARLDNIPRRSLTMRTEGLQPIMPRGRPSLATWVTIAIMVMTAFLVACSAATQSTGYRPSTPICSTVPPDQPCRFPKAVGEMVESGQLDQTSRWPVAPLGTPEHRDGVLSIFVPKLVEDLPSARDIISGDTFLFAEIRAATSGSPGFMVFDDPAVKDRDDLVLTGRNRYCATKLIVTPLPGGALVRDNIGIFYLTAFLESPESGIDQKDTFDAFSGAFFSVLRESEDSLLHYVREAPAGPRKYCYLMRYFDSMSRIVPMIELLNPEEPDRIGSVRKVLEATLAQAILSVSATTAELLVYEDRYDFSAPQLSRLIWTDISFMCHRLDNVLERCRNDLMPTLSDQLVGNDGPAPRRHQLLRNSRSFRNTVFGSTSSGRSGKATRRRAITEGLCRRKKVFTCFSQAEGGDQRRVQVLIIHRAEQPFGVGIVRLAVQGEAQIVGDIVVARIDLGDVRQLGELAREGLVQLVRVAAIVAVAGAGIEQGVAAEQARRVGVGQQADMAHGVARRVQHFQFHGLADGDLVAGLQAAVHAGNAVLGIVVSQDLGAGGRDHGLVPADMVAMLMGVEDLGDGPALVLGGGQAFLVVERIDGQGLAGFRAGDQIVEVAIGRWRSRSARRSRFGSRSVVQGVEGSHGRDSVSKVGKGNR